MSRSSFGKTSDEERLLTRKYKVLREKKEEVQEFRRVEALKEKEKKEKDRPFLNSPNSNYKMASPSAESKAKEEAKRLVMSGKISITNSQEQKKQSFKRASVLEKKLSEGRTTEVFQPMPASHHAAAGEVRNSDGMVENPTENQQPSSSGRTQLEPVPVPSSPAALGWKRAIESDRYRKNRSAGGYVDYKRRIVTYDDDKSCSDDED